MYKNRISRDAAQVLYVQLRKEQNRKTDVHPSFNANTPMQYTVIFHGCKNDNFPIKKCNIFLIFAQNIDCEYTIEQPQ